MAPHTPAHQSIFVITLTVAAVLWLLLLQVTHFNLVTVSLGLLVALGVLR